MFCDSHSRNGGNSLFLRFLLDNSLVRLQIVQLLFVLEKFKDKFSKLFIRNVKVRLKPYCLFPLDGEFSPFLVNLLTRSKDDLIGYCFIDTTSNFVWTELTTLVWKATTKTFSFTDAGKGSRRSARILSAAPNPKAK